MRHRAKGPGHGDILEGRYANYFEIGHNAFEFVLDLGQLYFGSRKPESTPELSPAPLTPSPWWEFSRMPSANTSRAMAEFPLRWKRVGVKP